MANELRTFVLVQGEKVVSPLLITVRDYATWMESYFDNYTCQLHLYLIKQNGVAEWHPGTRIGLYFNTTGKCSIPEYNSWYISKDSEAMQKLMKHNLASKVDCRKSKLRVFTYKQIEQYIKVNIDNNFDISSILMNPQQICVGSLEGIEAPKLNTKKKLF